MGVWIVAILGMGRGWKGKGKPCLSGKWIDWFHEVLMFIFIFSGGKFASFHSWLLISSNLKIHTYISPLAIIIIIIYLSHLFISLPFPSLTFLKPALCASAMHAKSIFYKMSKSRSEVK